MYKSAPLATTRSLVATPAFAANIDFTGSEFCDANHDSQYRCTADDGVTVTITAEPQPDATLYWDSRDGLGARYGYHEFSLAGLSYETREVLEAGWGRGERRTHGAGRRSLAGTGAAAAPMRVFCFAIGSSAPRGAGP